MGIKNFSTLLKDKASPAFIKMDIADLYGKRIAIDLNNLMYRYFSSYLKEEIYQTDIVQNNVNREKVVVKWIHGIIDFGLLWLEHGVTPVFVLDGDTRKEKEDTKQKRISEKKKARDTSQELLSKIRQSKSLFDIQSNDIIELKKQMSKDVSLKIEEVEQLTANLKDFKFPILRAEYDSEQLCCALAIEGKVEAVFSTDMDCLVYGTSYLITDFDKESRGEGLKLNAISLSKTLECLDVSFRTFVDVCIMCGCDFNQNMPKIGPKRSYDLMKEYEQIENLPDLYPIEILQHRKCREIFEFVESKIEEKQLCMALPYFEEKKDKSMERKWREGRLTMMMKQLPQPISKPYIQMPSLFERSHVEIVII
jgi:flap endonuclease-1